LLSAKSVGNSNDYGQLKSIDDSSDNYSRSTLIATAIRNEDQVRQRPLEESINQRQWKPTTNDEVQRSTINVHRQRTTIRKSAYLLTIRSLAFTFKMADKIDNQIIIDDKNYLPQSQRPQNYSHNRKGKGSGHYARYSDE